MRPLLPRTPASRRCEKKRDDCVTVHHGKLPSLP